MNIMGYSVLTKDMDIINLNNKQIINTINSHSFMIAKKDKIFNEALHDSDLLVPDGIGIVLAAKQIYHVSIKKIAGMDLHNYLLVKMNRKKGKVFYMGSSQSTLDRIKEKIKKEYPNINMKGYSPPFKAVFSKEENDRIIFEINNFNPDILFIGMTAPKQEKWLHKHRDMLNFKIASSIGAVFDFYAETTERPSQFWIDMNLEWLGRLIKEPKRMWKRNFISTPLFLFEILLFKIGFKK